MRTTNFDAIAAAAPLDRQASAVRDGSGDQWTPKISDHQQHWKAPPLPASTFQERIGGRKQIDFTGKVFGRLTVVRFHGVSGGSKQLAVWLVRCACGDYEIRRAKSLAYKSEINPCCHECKALDRLRHIASATNTRAVREEQAAALDRLAVAR